MPRRGHSILDVESERANVRSAWLAHSHIRVPCTLSRANIQTERHFLVDLILEGLALCFDTSGHQFRCLSFKHLQPRQILMDRGHDLRSEEHTSELQSLMRISYAVFCLKKKNHTSSKPLT